MLPAYRDICLPLLLEIAKRGGKTRPQEKRNGTTVYESLAIYFSLTRQDLAAEVNEPGAGKRNKWENMVRWARKDLVDWGYIDNSQRGIWRLTEKGLKAAAEKRID